MADELTVTYQVPEEIKEGMRDQISFLIRICPNWIKSLSVFWKTESDGHCVATMAADYKYRTAQLTIFPRWLDEDAESRKKVMVHEACHILNAPIWEFFTSIAEDLSDGDPRLLRVLQSQWRIANEAATEDMAAALFEAATLCEESAKASHLPQEPAAQDTHTLPAEPHTPTQGAPA